jgi:nucleotide-binding universal stress UspA family protein
MKPKRILVAVNGSKADAGVVELACDLSKRSKADIYAVYVVEVKRSLPLDAVIDSEMKKAEDVLTQAEEVAGERGCELEADIIQARDVGPAIVEEAVEREADLIIIGLTQKRRFGTFSLGNVILHVLKEAPCRVLLSRESLLVEVITA